MHYRYSDCLMHHILAIYTCNIIIYYECAFTLYRHADREAEPKNYDVTKSDIDERDLLRATYDRIGNITDGVSLI